MAVLAGLKDKAALQGYTQVQFVPFDPVNKKTESTIKDAKGSTFKVAKGAPQVVMELCRMDHEMTAKAQQAVDDLAAKGYRTLGVARSEDEGPWEFLAILPLFDPPRETRRPPSKTPGSMASRSRW